LPCPDPKIYELKFKLNKLPSNFPSFNMAISHYSKCLTITAHYLEAILVSANFHPFGTGSPLATLANLAGFFGASFTCGTSDSSYLIFLGLLVTNLCPSPSWLHPLKILLPCPFPYIFPIIFE